METQNITETGCYLDNHRGHYISRDVILLAEGFGYILGPVESYVLSLYDEHGNDPEYPNEAVIELCDHAVEWLNSGQDVCQECAVGSGDIRPGQVPMATVDDKGHVSGTAWVICKACSGSGRGPRIEGQNFPPKVPERYYWSFNDGDYGLYKEEELD